MSLTADTERNRGRPPTNLTDVDVKLPSDELELLDLWIAGNGAGMTRPEALRRILKRVAVRMPPRFEPPANLAQVDHELPAKPIGGDGGNY